MQSQVKYIKDEKDSIGHLIKSLEMLNLIPRSGNGHVEITFQNGILLDTVLLNRVRFNVRVKSINYDS